MFLMFPRNEGPAALPTILIVDERGRLREAVTSVEDGLRWLYKNGHRRIGTPDGKEIEVFLIERRTDQNVERQRFTLRRDPAGKPTGEALRRSLGKKVWAQVRRSIGPGFIPASKRKKTGS